MRIIAYLGFTLLSIFIQFCVMDFIQEKLQDEGTLDFNTTKPNTDMNDIIFRNSNQVRKIRKVNSEMKKSIYNNISKLIQSGFSTEMTSTMLDIFYDDNMSTTDLSFTTEVLQSTEIDNVTEINFPVDVKPPSKADIKPKSMKKDCNCNLMYEICDTNCCCDIDCTEDEEHLFGCNDVNNTTNNQNDGVCYAYLFHNDHRYRNNFVDNMLCIVKINLPEKRKSSHNKFYESMLQHHHFKWRNHDNVKAGHKFTKAIYKIGDPIWLLNNSSILHIDLPHPFINDYCNKRRLMTFFKDEEIKCIVKLRDLEMFHILKLAEQTIIISATNISTNSSSLNCSSLYCANWTIFVCNEIKCDYYNKSYHEPTCTDATCHNIALMVDYIFYVHQTTIINVTVKLYVQKISIVRPYMLQKIRVFFLLTNKSIDEIVKYSGNPGYQKGLKVIFSYAQTNYTENFFSSRIDSANHFVLPTIKNAQCVFPNITDNFITFGSNKRIQCRYMHKEYPGNTNNDVCKTIHANIRKLLFINDTMAVSPYGNPQHVTDKEWIVLNVNNSQLDPVYGLFDANTSKIFCYNLIKKISLSFAFANLDEKGNKILSVKHQVVISNKSFTIQDMSTVITIDISFIDVTKPAVFEYATSPHIDINLPKDFFFPSNKSNFQCSNVYIIIIYCCTVFFK